MMMNRQISVLQTEGLPSELHMHEEVEMTGVWKGTMTAVMEDEVFDMTVGDLLVIFPHRRHQFTGGELGLFITLLFPAEAADEFRALFVQKVPQTPLIKGGLADVQLAKTLHMLAQLSAQERDIAQDMKMKGCFFEFLGCVFEKLSLCRQDTAGMATMNQILNYCMVHANEKLQLQDVADALHINKYYISRLFQRKFSMGFGEYVRRLRVDTACLLLRDGELSVTQVAYSAGFSSTRTFNRVFGDYMGMTPSAYRKQYLQAADSQEVQEWNMGELPEEGTAAYILRGDEGGLPRRDG